jgi:hypothetical protein
VHRNADGAGPFIRRFNLQLRPFGAPRNGAVHGQLARIRTAISSEQLLHRLNGQTVAAGARSWRVDVYSIVENDAHRWIQVGLDGSDRRTILLKLEYLADDEDAVAALERWVRHSSAIHGGVITVSDSE